MLTSEVAKITVHVGEFRASSCKELLVFMLDSRIASVNRRKLREVAVKEARVSGVEGYALIGPEAVSKAEAFLPIRQQGGRWKVNGQIPLPLHMMVPGERAKASPRP
jgi:hypothetical protein